MHLGGNGYLINQSIEFSGGGLETSSSNKDQQLPFLYVAITLWVGPL